MNGRFHPGGHGHGQLVPLAVGVHQGDALAWHRLPGGLAEPGDQREQCPIIDVDQGFLISPPVSDIFSPDETHQSYSGADPSLSLRADLAGPLLSGPNSTLAVSALVLFPGCRRPLGLEMVLRPRGGGPGR